jgi:hypothetical protein
MNFQEIKEIIETIGNEYAEVTKTNDDKLIGVIDGPFRGNPQSKLDAFKKDYLYVQRIDKKFNPIERVYLDDIASISRRS